MTAESSGRWTAVEHGYPECCYRNCSLALLGVHDFPVSVKVGLGVLPHGEGSKATRAPYPRRAHWYQSSTFSTEARDQVLAAGSAACSSSSSAFLAERM